MPIAGAIYNAGYWSASTEKPKAVILAKSLGIDPITSHFMQPPPMALLLAPLGWVETAAHGYLVWLLLSAVAVWSAAILSGRIYERCAGKRSWWTGGLLLLIAFVPTTSHAIYVANVSAFMAASIGLAMLSLDPNAPLPATGAAAIVFSTMVKYSGLLFLPIAIRMRVWRTLIWTALLTVAWTGATLLVMGIGPFREYFSAIVPTLGRPHDYADNVSLAGVMLRLLNRQPPLPAAVTVLTAIFQFGIFIGILLLLWAQDSAMTIDSIAAATAALVAWLLFFSPITWTHYLVYLYPIWGWMIWNGRRSKLHSIVTIVAIGIVVVSLSTEPPTRLDPYGVRYLLSLSLTFALGVESLSRTAKWRKPQWERVELKAAEQGGLASS